MGIDGLWGMARFLTRRQYYFLVPIRSSMTAMVFYCRSKVSEEKRY
jgi:hypothetical protein